MSFYLFSVAFIFARVGQRYHASEDSLCVLKQEYHACQTFPCQFNYPISLSAAGSRFAYHPTYNRVAFVYVDVARIGIRVFLANVASLQTF